MNDIKIKIVYEFKKGPWGGGNQFLKALRKELIKKNLYVENPNKADCFLFNSHHNYKKILTLKRSHPKKVFIHRIDGPLYLIRGDNLKIDKKIYQLTNYVADGTIFQSNWSKQKNLSSGLKGNKFETIILNSCDNSIFYPRMDKKYNNKKKWNLVAVSWSKNFNKGFDLYRYLDKNLDFNKYTVNFIGNSPISFKNIKHIKPVEPRELANYLRDADLFVTGSKNDPCSNSLIEALSCGLPAIVLNDGGHPEIIKNGGGEIFTTFEECLQKIQYVKENCQAYRKNISIPNIEEITNLYISFIRKIYYLVSEKKYVCKNITLANYYNLLLKEKIFKISILNRLYNRITN
jgi:glycosyltransferase involved in cell wall biosynthesis